MTDYDHAFLYEQCDIPPGQTLDEWRRINRPIKRAPWWRRITR